MNKTLLTSVSLLAVLLSSHTSSADHVVARADNLKITVGADVNMQGGYQPKSKTKVNTRILDASAASGKVIKIGPSANNNDLAFVTSASAFLGAENKTKSDLVYGVQVGLFTTTNGDFPSKDHLGRTYVYFQRDDFGKFEIGTKRGASTSMAIDGDDATAGTGAFNGDWSHYLSLTSYEGPNYDKYLTNDQNFSDSTRLIIKDNNADSSNDEGCRKVTYYTPKYEGFQLGFSFIPDEANRGGNAEKESPFVKTGPTGNLKNAIMASVSYEKQIDAKQKLKVALVGETGRFVRSYQDVLENNKYPNQPVAFAIGAQYDYDKFSIAGSFGDKGRLKYPKQPKLKDSIFYNIGLGYQCTEKIKTSIAYFHSDNRNTVDIFSVGAHYNWLSGVQPYAEFNYLIAHQKYNFMQPVASGAARTLQGATFLGNTAKATNTKTRGAAAIVGIRLDL
jgi:hypothetical protein